MFIVYALSLAAILLFLGWLLGLIGRRLGIANVDGRKGIVNLDAASDALVLLEADRGQAFQIQVFRQSGNLERELTCATRHEAISSVLSIFRRMREPSVRIWKNTETTADLRRPYGSFRGKNEGRKLWGCTIQIVPTA